jgi:S-adenosylmethionine/arginine decarboxylase-like enzyme
LTAHASQLTADFVGVPGEQLRDREMLSGLLIAAAGAAGFAATALPLVRARDEGTGAVLLLDGCHITVHTFPTREVLLLDVLASSEGDARRAFDVFCRRLTAREVKTKTMQRG